MLVRFFIIVVLASVPSFVFAQTESVPSPTFDNNSATAICVEKVQNWYNDEINLCLTAKDKQSQEHQSQLVKEFTDAQKKIQYTKMNDYDAQAAVASVAEIQRKIQVGLISAQTERQTCYEGALLGEFKQKIAVCYQNSSFGDIWELPIMKQVLVNQFSDFENLSAEKTVALDACLQTVNEQHNLQEVSATAQRAISRCLVAAGLKGAADVQTKTADVIDCATAKWPIKTAADVRHLAANQSADDRVYLEKCVMTKIAPAAIGTAAASIPLAAGWRSVFLFGQLVVTQPLILLRRRKYKTWGTVFDSSTTEPVDLGSVRLVGNTDNRIIGTAVTNKQGQYLFLPAPGEYRVLVDKPGYIFPSALLSRGGYERDHYFGEPIAIRKASEIVDRHIPIDPHSGPALIWKFYLRQWRYRFAVVFGFISPLISVVGFIILRTWWLGIFVAAHILVFGIFFRLSLRNRARKFGVVRTKDKQTLSGVTVSLFRVGDKKLLNYYVTDLFGRYFFPRLVGDYTIVFSKVGYKKKEINYSIAHDDTEKSTIMFDAVLDKNP